MATTQEHEIVTSPHQADAIDEPRSLDAVKSVFARVCVAITLAIGFLLAGEIWSYFRLHPRSSTAAESHTQSIYKGQAWAPTFWKEKPIASANLEYRPYTVWRRPAFHGQTINIDDNGYRQTDFANCTGNEFTIWMFGNSALWGASAPDWATIPSYLAEDYKNAGNAICVRNFAEMGWVSTQSMVQLLLALKHETRKPDLVIFYDGVSDTFLPSESNTPDAHMSFESIKKGMEGQMAERNTPFNYLKRSYTYRYLELLSTSLSRPWHAPKGAAMDYEAEAQATRNNYLANLRMVEGLGRAFGFRCLFIWQPTLLSGRKPLTPEEEQERRAQEKKLAGSERLCQTTYREFDNIQDPDFVNFADLLKDHHETLFADYSHLGPQGNQIVAERIYREIQSRGLNARDNSPKS
jgi:lysophospholipase L1-like esterase